MKLPPVCPKDDIGKMEKGAEAHAEDDKKKRESAEVKNNANALVYTAEKSLSDAGELKFPPM